MLYLDAADLIERPLHRLGLHSVAWVATAAVLAAVIAGVVVLATTLLARRGPVLK